MITYFLIELLLLLALVDNLPDKFRLLGLVVTDLRIELRDNNQQILLQFNQMEGNKIIFDLALINIDNRVVFLLDEITNY